MTSLNHTVIPGSTGTSSGGALVYKSLRVICIAGALTISGTHSADASSDHVRESTAQTDSGLRAEKYASAESVVMEIRRLSGMTWEQLASLFGVTRRTVHFWASGSTLNAANEENLYRIVSTIRKVDRGSASENRNALFTPQQDGVAPIDLLREGHFAEVVERLGDTKRQIYTLIPISPESSAARSRIAPEVLANALQDKLHRDSGRIRMARTFRVKNKITGAES